MMGISTKSVMFFDDDMKIGKVVSASAELFDIAEGKTVGMLARGRRVRLQEIMEGPEKGQMLLEIVVPGNFLFVQFEVAA